MANNYDQFIVDFLTEAKSVQNGIPLTQNKKIVIPNRASLLIALNRFSERNPTLIKELGQFSRFRYRYHYADSGLQTGIKFYFRYENNGFSLLLMLCFWLVRIQN
jgi:hypothetical protein